MADRKRERRKPSEYAQLNALMRSEVSTIARLRLGRDDLPENHEGERYLKALIFLKLPVDEVHEVAPWCSGGDLDRLRADVDRDRRHFRNARDYVGDLIEFQFTDLVELWRHGFSVRWTAPFDCQRSQVQEFWKVVDKQRDRVRKRENRAMSKSMNGTKLKPLARACIRILNGWTAVPFIAAKMIESPARHRPRTAGAAKKAVHRAIDDLITAGIIEAELRIVPDKTSRVVKFVRLKPPMST